MELTRDGKRPIRVAHRGGNSRRALRSALEAGVDWLEVDIWLHYGRLVARHDRGVWRLPMTYSSRSLRLSLRPLLRLDALISATEGTDVRLMVDLKGEAPGLPGAIVETLRERGALERAALCTQEWEPLEEALRIEPEAAVFFSLGRPEHLAAYLARRRDSSAPTVTSCSHRLLTPQTVAALKDAGSTIIAWTVDSETRAQALLDWGVDGITSNNYQMLARLPRRKPAEE